MSERKVGASPILGAPYGESKPITGDVYQQVNIQMNGQSKNSIETIGEGLSGLNHSIGRALSPVRFKGGFSVSWRWCLFLAACFVPNQDISAICAILWMLSLFVKR